MTDLPDLRRGRAPYDSALVFTMGKVASTTITAGLQGAGVPCDDIHSLDRGYLWPLVARRLAQGRRPPPHARHALWHHRRLARPDPARLIITLVRDPIARNLSAFFQTLPLARIKDPDPDALLAQFRDHYPHGTPASWFQREMAQSLGIDVYARPFPRARLFHYRPRDHLVIFRTDCPDPVKAAVLSQLLGRDITLTRANVGASKHYHALYAAVQARAQFAPAFCAPFYRSLYVRHFWTPRERQALLARWVAPPPA